MKPKNSENKLLLEKISLSGIVLATGMSEKLLQNYVNNKYTQVKSHPRRGRL
jgi:hypothetical protein